jgi:hypothetical protein
MHEFNVNIASGCRLQAEKGEDAVLVRSEGDSHLLAVADGVSMSDGRVAANTVIDILRNAPRLDDARTVFADLLAALPRAGDYPSSATTLTCGVLRPVLADASPHLRFDFFAVGDSPIWRVVQLPAGGRYSFQRYVVHGTPYPSETAKVYATIRPHNLDPIAGSIAFGRVDIPISESLIICTDGIPERDIFAREQLNSGSEPNGRPLTFCEWLFEPTVYDDKSVERLLENYDSRGLLYDDASLIVVRLRIRQVIASRSRTEQIDVSPIECVDSVNSEKDVIAGRRMVGPPEGTFNDITGGTSLVSSTSNSPGDKGSTTAVSVPVDSDEPVAATDIAASAERPKLQRRTSSVKGVTKRKRHK